MSPAGRPLRDRRWAVPAVVAICALIWLAAVSPGGIDPLDLLAGLVAAGIGYLAARPAALRSPMHYPGGRPAERSDGAALDEEVDHLRLVLLRLASTLDVVRVTIWERDVEAGVLRPVCSSHVPPPQVPAAGEPMTWALEQGQPLRVERKPVWAEGPLTAAPVPGGYVLTAEGLEASPAPDRVADAAAMAGSLMVLQEREARSGALAGRFNRFVDFLKSLPGGAEAERFPDELARAIGEMAEADGAVVASWDEERGQVLATWGTGGGPAPGTYFAVMQGELGMAARAQGAIDRTPAGRPPVLAQAGERWTTIPEHLTARSLADSSGRVRGVVAFWGSTPCEAAVKDLISALAPLLALQLQHSTDLVRFRQRAHEDGLTGLRNRAALDERIADERHRFHRYRRPVSLLVLDLDHFKRINDTWGHAAGDAVLERVAELLRAAIREADFAARFGGEELVVLLPETMRREALEVAERIRKAVSEAVVEWNGKQIPVSTSVGVSSCPEIVEDPGELLRSADEALYVSKSQGRNRVTVAEKATSGG